ncbi:MAG: glycosyltransferase [bacterium]
MKIVQIVSSYPPYRGGMGKVAESLHRFFLEQKIKSVVYTPRYHYQRQQTAGVKRLIPFLTWGNSAWLPQLFFRLLSASTIIVHYPFYGAAEYALLVKTLCPWKRLLVIYHMDPQPTGLAKIIGKCYDALILPWLVRTTDQFFVSSLDYFKSSALSPWWKGIEKKTTELPFGVEAEWLEDIPTREPPSTELKLLFVGGLDQSHHFKGLSVLLEALTGLPDQVTLEIVGNGNNRLLFERQAIELGVNERVKFLGNLATEKLMEKYQQSHFTVLPSLGRAEAFGLVLVESMSQGTPVIASCLPGVRTVFEDGITGYSVEPGSVKSLRETILKALHGIGNWMEMSLRSRERVRNRYDLGKNFGIILPFLK